MGVTLVVSIVLLCVLLGILLVTLGYHWVWGILLLLHFTLDIGIVTGSSLFYLGCLTLLRLWHSEIHGISVMCMFNKHKPYRSGTFHGMARRTDGKRGLININNAIYSCSECGQELYREPNLERD